MLTAYGLDLTGWELDEGKGISADGRVIVGLGHNPSGFDEGWIAVIPEPKLTFEYILEVSHTVRGIPDERIGIAPAYDCGSIR